MVTLSDLWLRFQGHGITEGEYLKKGIEWYLFQWPWMTSNPDFKVTTFFEVDCRKNQIPKTKTKLLLHKRKLCLTYGMLLFGDIDWPLNASRGFVSISWASCFCYCWSYFLHKWFIYHYDILHFINLKVRFVTYPTYLILQLTFQPQNCRAS